MLLSDRDLSLAVDAGAIQFNPDVDPDAIQPSSIDVRLHPQYRAFAKWSEAIDTRRPPADLTTLHTAGEDEPIRVHPGEFLLCSTLEAVTLDDRHTAKLEGRSSLGRLGLIIHATAGLIDAGFSGHVTLEVGNVGPIPLDIWPGDRVAQLCVHRLSSPCVQPYGARGRYQGQSGPTASRGIAGTDQPAAPTVRLGPNDCQPCHEGGARVWHHAHGLDPDTCGGKCGRES
jgi:dCTP deaminase